MTHDYKRLGTIDLFAAMTVAAGEVLTDLRKGHTGADCCGSSNRSTPRFLAIRTCMSSWTTCQRSTPAIAKWLAHKDRRRWNMHFTPTSSSWLNLIERWFQGTHPQTPAPRSLQRCRRSHRGDHHWAEYWNRDPKPFVWKATADDIIAKVQRGRDTLRQIKSQTDH